MKFTKLYFILASTTCVLSTLLPQANKAACHGSCYIPLWS